MPREILPPGGLTTCDACSRDLSSRGQRKTGLCQSCRSEGARFARAWMADLKASGMTYAQVADVVGTTRAAVRTRLFERRHGVTP